MDFGLTEEQLQYVDTVRRFVRERIAPGVVARELAEGFPRDLIRAAWEMGVLNLCLPETIKGYEIDMVSTALIVKELAYGDAGLATSAMCNDLANAVIVQHGTEAQQRAFLSPFAAAPCLASFCLTEPDAGSDNLSMKTFLCRREDGTYVLNGAKCFITNASFASQFTVFCKLGKPSSQFLACVVIPAEDRGDGMPIPERENQTIVLGRGGCITIGRPEAKLGLRLSNTASVTFDDVVVEAHQVIGDRRLGFRYLIDVLDYARPMVAAIGVGLARRALDRPLDYARSRRQFGEAIADLPVARNTLVAMWKKVELAELALLQAVWKVQTQAEDRGMYASLAKNAAAEAALFCTREGLHLHGGYGFMEDYEIAKLARDAHIIDIYEGVREVQDMIIGRGLV